MIRSLKHLHFKGLIISFNNHNTKDSIKPKKDIIDVDKAIATTIHPELLLLLDALVSGLCINSSILSNKENITFLLAK